MCIPGTTRPQQQAPLPVAQAAAPAPTREAVATGTDPVSLVEQTKQTVAKRLGIFGNLRTSPLGDAAYGMFAKFGAK